MEKVNISFGGMTNIPDDSFSNDGEMAVLLNMRHKGGELVECKQPSTLSLAYKVTKAMLHAKSGMWLELRENGELWLRDGNEAIQDDVVSFAIMGNIVVMYREKMPPCYLIWRGTEYVKLGELPELPELKITRNDNNFSFTTQEKYPASVMLALEDDGLENYAGFVKKGFIDSCLSEVYSRGGFVDNVLFRVCYKLFDGSCIASDVYSAYNDAMAFKFIPEKGTIDENRLYYKAEVKYFTVDVSLHNFSGIEDWKDVISGIEVYTSGSIMNHKPVTVSYTTDEYKGVEDAYVKYDIYELRTLKDVREEIMSAGFYKYMSFDLKGDLIKTHIENTSPSNVVTQYSLKDIASMHSGMGGVGVYNNRLHINGDRLLYDGYRYNNRIGVINDWVTIVTDIGQYIVKRREEQSYVDLKETPILMYPDSRAEKMTIVYHKTDKWYKGEFELRPHPYENAAIYINQGIVDRERKFSKAISEVNITSNSGVDVKDFYFEEIEEGAYIFEKKNGIWYFRKDWVQVGSGKAYPLIRKGQLADFGIKQTGTIDDGSSFKVDVLYASNSGYALSKLTFGDISQEEYNKILGTKENNIENANDEIKVSAVDNPFYFPTAQTYKFDAEIVGIASNAEDISTGQFGQYPLFVFTKSGIWAMGVDASGQGAYTTMSPFSREVCSGDICPVSGGIVFATKRGLMAISGGQVTELSAIADGRRFDFFDFNKGLWSAIFGKDDLIITPDEIRRYIDGAKLGYNYLHNEIIVSNSSYGYSYVYSLTGGKWSVIDSVFDVTTNNYPELVVYDNSRKRILAFNDESEGDVRVVAITRPFTIGTLDFKKVRQAALRCTFTGSLNFYLLGSIDGAEFKVITGKEYPSVNGNELTTVTRRDLITSMSRSKQYRFFVIAITGYMTGRISLAEIVVDGSFTGNMLR